MKAKLLAAAVAVSGTMLFSSGASAALCSTFTTLGAFTAGDTCVDDADQDLLFTFNSTTLPADTTFEVIEAEGGGVDFYAINLSFPGGLSPAANLTLDFTLTVVGGPPAEFLDAANFDTVVQGSGFVATAELSDGGGTFLTLTSTNGSRDPAQGETGFTDRTFVHVIDTLKPGTGLYTSASNSFDVVEVQAPEPATLGLIGIALAGLGFAQRRRKS